MKIYNKEAHSDPDNDDNEECWNEDSKSSVDEGIQFNENYGILVSKVHKTVNLFRKS